MSTENGYSVKTTKGYTFQDISTERNRCLAGPSIQPHCSHNNRVIHKHRVILLTERRHCDAGHMYYHDEELASSLSKRMRFFLDALWVLITEPWKCVGLCVILKPVVSIATVLTCSSNSLC